MSRFGPVFIEVKPLFKERGYRKSGNNFYRITDDQLLAVNFQGSSGGNGFYINYGSREYTASEGATKPTSRELQVSSGRISLLSQVGTWLYEMGSVELAILTRKLDECMTALENGGT